MSKIVLDEALRSKLNGLNEPLELYDDSGKRMGHFLPEQLFSEWIMALSKARISDEDLDRRMEEPGGKSLNEIWERLGLS
jgi:hypothetical protein